MRSRFPVLVRAFLARMFESDAAGQATDLRASFFWLIAFLAMPGFVVPILISLASFAPSPETWGWAMIAKYRGLEALRAASLGDKTLYLSFTLIVSGCLAIGVWRRLLPDVRDARILGALPVSAPLVILARLASTLVYIGIVASAMHAVASLSFGFFLAAENTVGFALRGIVAHFVAASAASLFMFLLVIAAQAVTLTLVGPRRFGRWSAIVQVLLVAGVVACVLVTPIASGGAREAVLGAAPPRTWLLDVPQLWFLGLYEVVLGTSQPVLMTLSRSAIVLLAALACVVLVTLPLTYRRLVEAVAERSDLRRVARSARVIERLVAIAGGSIRQRAITQFIVSGLLRDERLRLGLLAGGAVALLWIAPAAYAAYAGLPAAPGVALISVPIAVLLCLLAALRFAMGLSSDAGAAWMFDVFTIDVGDVRAALVRVLWRLVAWPLVAATTVIAGAFWGAVPALVHAAFFSAVASLAIAVLFRGFEHVPCSRAWNGEALGARTWWPLAILSFGASISALASIEYLLFQIPLAAPLIAGLLWSVEGRGLFRKLRRVDDRAGRAEGRPSLDLRAIRNSDGSSAPLLSIVRRLVKAPAFALFSIATLAVGIGATTAAHAFMVATTERPMQVRDAGRVMTISSMTTASLSWLDFEDLRAQQTSFASVEASSEFGTSLRGRDRAVLVAGELVTGGYFDALGVAPMFGRLIQAADDRPSAPPAAVVSESTWRRAFGADPAAVGSVIRIGGEPYTMVGVVPASFRGLRATSRQPAIWVAMAHPPTTDRALTAFRDPTRRNRRYLHPIGRLVDGRSPVQARAELDAIGARLDRDTPMTTGQAARAMSQRRWTGSTLSSDLDRRDTGRVRLMIVLLPVLVLLVACTNLANLTLSRGSGRAHEIAVRTALGASRRSLVRDLVVEHGLLALAGGLLGVIAARGLLTSLVAAVERTLGYAPQYQFEPQLGPGTMVVAIGAVLLAMMAAGLLPALRLTSGDPRSVLAGGGGSVVPSWRGRSSLIAMQVAVSVTLLMVAALCLRQLMAQQTVDGPQIDIDRLAIADVPFSSIDRGEDATRRVLDRVLDDLRQVPGIESAAVASGFPGADHRAGYAVAYETAAPDRGFAGTGETPRYAAVRSVTPPFFATTGLAVVRGRAIDGRDVAGTPAVAVVTERHAQALFGTPDVVGRQVLMQRTDVLASGPEALTIVGVAADDARVASPRESGVVYTSFAQRFEPDVLLIARAAPGTNPQALVTSLQTITSRASPDVAIRFAGPASLIGGEVMFVLRTVVQVATSLAFVALVLSMVGLYGVLSHVVAGRTREMGLRIALGAEPHHLRRLIFGDGFRPVWQGILAGLAVAGIVRMSLRPLFVGSTAAFDPVAVVIAIVPLVAGAALACFLPSRRASRVDPNVALRDS